MPHRRPYKKWKHLQDAICSMELDPVAYILSDIGIDVSTDDVTYAAQIVKKHLAVDACNIQDEHDFKVSFAEHLNALGSDITGIEDISKHPDWNGIYDTIVVKMAERADIRRVRAQPRNPSHYTDETPEGALEGMERRLSGASSTSQDLLLDALAQMELKVGELSDAVSRMGPSVPAPIVEAVEAVEDAIEEVEAQAGFTGQEKKSVGIRAYIMNLSDPTSENVATVVTALQSFYPDITERDVTNAVRLIPGGSPLGRIQRRMRRRTPTPAPAPAPIPTPRTRRGRIGGMQAGGRTQGIRAYALSLGSGLADMTSGDIVRNLRSQFPEITSQHVLEALNTRWQAENNAPPLKRAYLGRRPATAPTEQSPGIPPGQAADLPPGTSLAERLRQMPRPEARRRIVQPRWMTRRQEQVDEIRRLIKREFHGSFEANREFNKMTYDEILRHLKTTYVDEVTENIGVRKLSEIISPEWLESQGMPRPEGQRRGKWSHFPDPRGGGGFDYDERQWGNQETVQGFVNTSFNHSREAKRELASHSYEGLFALIKDGLMEVAIPGLTLEEVRQAISPEWLRERGLPQLQSYSWSRAYYMGLSDSQHQANDEWFATMLRMLKDDGILGVPNLQKAFNKQGQEVSFPTDSNPPMPANYTEANCPYGV
jgi:hypothetical protein